jgi:hypothetical protein
VTWWEGNKWNKLVNIFGIIHWHVHRLLAWKVLNGNDWPQVTQQLYVLSARNVQKLACYFVMALQINHRQLVVTIFALSWLKCKGIVDAVQFLVWHYSIWNCNVMSVVVLTWHDIHEDWNLIPSAIRISVFLFSLAETETSGTGDNETSSYACCYNGCVSTCAKKLEPPIGKNLTPCPLLQRFVSLFRTGCILLQR